MLRFEAGAALDPAASGAPELAADLLAHVHRLVLAGDMPEVPARILDWAEAFLPEAGVAEARRRPAQGELFAGLTQGVVYGDPSPGDPGRARPASGADRLGTPSWGPLIHDVAAWALRFSAGDPRRFDRFVGRYQQHSVLGPTEYDRLADAVALASSLTVTSPG